MFQTEIAVRLQHTDAAGVMFFVRIFELAHLAYEEFLESIGVPIPQDMRGGEVVIPIVHAEADYRTPLRLGDRVQVELVVGKLRARSFTLDYTFTKSDGTTAGTAQTVHVVVDPGTGRAMTMPDALREGLSGA